jgi:transketolase C-terminal domain/subunit
MVGNRGLMYVRVNRAAYPALYGPEFTFEFGRGYMLRETASDQAVIVSSGRGVYEALAAAEECSREGLSVAVVDMPSIDEELLLHLHDSQKPIILAEQNNGYIWQNFLKILYRKRKPHLSFEKIIAVNTLTPEGSPRFIHSGTYEELIEAFALSPARLAQTVREKAPR